ncbi:MAG: tRNA cyclic N6-threonylcarbamoyladenosine(37) synthase TcdA [Pseudomonadales bacterium]|nr:tRNA cyclic N6-threonylcarbamoyladenosine(37) synthase TcdA [Pseudomonadales bacterium]
MPLSSDYLQRFSGIARLYGSESLTHLSQAHFIVIGLGGVGSWVAEALARSGIGEISLMDLDDLCITNTNRQLPALTSTIGHSKVATLAARLSDINPEIKIHQIEDFLDQENLKEHIHPHHNFVIDAIDAASVKACLIAYCSARKIPMLTAGSAGGKSDPRQVTSDDLSRTISDPMLAKVRQLLFKRHGFRSDSNRKFRIEAVYSPEQAIFPKPDGQVCAQKSAMQDGIKLDCSGGFGASTMLAGTMGFVAAERAIKKFLRKENEKKNAEKEGQHPT